jgi:hypothetical protein
MKNILLSTLAVATLALAIPAHANTITISLTNPDQTGTVGQTLQYFGVITNNTNATVNLDGDALILNSPGINLIDDFNDPDVPFFLTADGAPGASSGIIELFDVSLSAGFTGINLGTYDITGDSGTAIGATTFSVAPAAAPLAATPEPASIILLLTSLPAALPLFRRRNRY